LKTVQGIAENSLQEIPQNNKRQTTNQELRHAPKIFTNTCIIVWEKTTAEVHNLIRGLSPYPAAFTKLHGKNLKIFRAEKIEGLHSSIQAGNFETDKASFLRFACSDGYINIIELQLEGKKKMPVADFLRGYHFE
jgi:methionyl-tRNA formyltransferase